MGSKRIKALAVRGDRRTPLADPRRPSSWPATSPPGRSARRPRSIASWGPWPTCSPSTASTPCRPGTSRSGHFEGADRLAGARPRPGSPVVARKSCASCTIGCEHIYAVGKARRGPAGIRVAVRPRPALRRGRPRGRSSGPPRPATRRAWTRSRPAGRSPSSWNASSAAGSTAGSPGRAGPLRFGDGEAVLEAIAALLDREGIGEWLALGSRAGRRRIGGEAAGLAPHVKGLELPGYDPRALHTMALGLAVGTRGADHNRSGAYEADFSGRVDRRRGRRRLGPRGDRDRGPRRPDRLADPLQVPPRRLRRPLRRVRRDAPRRDRLGRRRRRTPETARRVVNARKCLNRREGWTRAEDTLPARFLTEETDPGAPTLSRGRLDAMIAAYYRGRGWDERGEVPDPLRRELGIDGPEFGGPLGEGVSDCEIDARMPCRRPQGRSVLHSAIEYRPCGFSFTGPSADSPHGLLPTRHPDGLPGRGPRPARRLGPAAPPGRHAHPRLLRHPLRLPRLCRDRPVGPRPAHRVHAQARLSPPARPPSAPSRASSRGSTRRPWRPPWRGGSPTCWASRAARPCRRWPWTARRSAAASRRTPRRSTSWRRWTRPPAASWARSRVDAKTNEHKAALELLAGLALRGRVVTGDAMFCQRDLSRQVIEAGGHYLWKVDDNQPSLKEAIASAFEPACSPLRSGCRPLRLDRARTLDAHGDRVETRTAGGHHDAGRLPGLARRGQVCRVESRGQGGGGETYEVSYAITSVPRDQAGAATLLGWHRGHWGIENRAALRPRRDDGRGRQPDAGRVGPAGAGGVAERGDQPSAGWPDRATSPRRCDATRPASATCSKVCAS